MDREIVRLRFFEGLSFPKIGERFGRDESTIRERFQDILQKLAQELKELR
jgi:DNA-directed RNA polymerase specialized sigma24 family protein